MSDKGVLGQMIEDLLTPPPITGMRVAPETSQERHDVIEAAIRRALAALADGSPEAARSHLEEALQRCNPQCPTG